jgi:predicted dehydrogenase
MPTDSEITLPVALVGGGMFGGDVVLRSIRDLECCGLPPYLGRVGLDHLARDYYRVRFRLVAVGTRTRETATRLCEAYRAEVPGAKPEPYWGEAPWETIFERAPQPRILLVATPDHLHHAPVLCALRHDAHVMVEKPLTLSLSEADELLAAARQRNRIVGVDMHKRYDPCHRFLFDELVPQIGTPLYGRAVLEEPLEVSTQTFKWAARSNPFSYVGIHWLDLFAHYLGLQPAAVHAVGQKELLVNWDRESGAAGARRVDTFDAMQVAVDYRGGMRVYYVNNWINPPEFEAPVNQEMEIAGTRGKIEFDQQYRGLRATLSGVGTRTFNPHFTGDIRRESRNGGDAPHPLAALRAYDGYGKDSIVAIVERATRVELGLARREELAGTYPDIESSRASVAVVEAAAAVAERNFAHLRGGRGAPVTARLSEAGIDLFDPGANTGEPAALRLYEGNVY